MKIIKSNIFIPEKINVGFQNRSDTYTKKLAYVIYYDQKGVLRKEKSWNSWRDYKIEPIEFENKPTSGFVLNKKAGGYSTGWNHRQTYVRVYDPRDFEFEISIPNLLYILENTNSIKGKGLEGEFVYGWDGTELVLIPTDSPDYVEISQFNEIIHANNQIKVKDLKLGATYKTKVNEEWIYMGRFDYWKHKYKDYDYTRREYNYEWVNKGKYHYFAREYKYDWENEPRLQTLQLKSLGDKFITVISEECVENYSELFDKLECTTEYSPIDENKDEWILYTYEEFYTKLNNGYFYCYGFNKKKYEVRQVYREPSKYYFEERNNYTIYSNNKSEGTIEEIYNKLRPMYKNEYLANGKLYRKGF